MDTFGEFLEPVVILTPSLDDDSLPYTDITFSELQSSAVVRFKSRPKEQYGEYIATGQNSVMTNMDVNFYFTLSQESYLSIKNYIRWEGKVYKIKTLGVVRALIPHIQICASLVAGDIF